jgi:alpha-tubulin suppressor-like RCC1 family protein
VQQLGTASSIASGDSHVCAITDDGSVYCWGKDGNFGPNIYGALPLLITGIGPAEYLATADSSNCAIQRDHAVMCWGFNAKGQLGNGNTTSSATPVVVVGLPNED